MKAIEGERKREANFKVRINKRRIFLFFLRCNEVTITFDKETKEGFR